MSKFKRKFWIDHSEGSIHFIYRNLLTLEFNEQSKSHRVTALILKLERQLIYASLRDNERKDQTVIVKDQMCKKPKLDTAERS